MAAPSGKRVWKAPFTITSMEVKDIRFPTSQGKHGSDAMVSLWATLSLLCTWDVIILNVMNKLIETGSYLFFITSILHAQATHIQFYYSTYNSCQIGTNIVLQS